MDYNEACKLLNGEEGGLAEWNRRRLAEWNRRRSAGEEIPSPPGEEILSPAGEEIPTLEGADLHGARLHRARLDKANNLTQEQLESARGDSKTELPEGLVRPKSWEQGESNVWVNLRAIGCHENKATAFTILPKLPIFHDLRVPQGGMANCLENRAVIPFNPTQTAHFSSGWVQPWLHDELL